MLAPPPIIDIEASGFGRGSYPIEVGYVLADGQAFCSLVKPESNWEHWDKEAERIHQISYETLLQYGKSASDVAESLNQSLNGLTIYSDGWFHDYSWMATLFEAADMSQQFRIEPLYGLFHPGQEELWHITKDRLEAIAGHQRHRASSDALLIQQTYNETLNLSQIGKLGTN